MRPLCGGGATRLDSLCRKADLQVDEIFRMGCAMVDVFYTVIAAGLFIAACFYARACAHI